ncbi:hypothetical protein [Scytonema hofmannii]|uniref:hypothetical protein n=1 Tax=Scytonema hofmannii TaxID=34078 RepID=UPI0011DFBCEC|nr:hypothetical protein [Scytonema hofmannii]
MSKAPPTSYTHTSKAESPSCFPGIDIPQEIPNTATAVTIIIVIVVFIRALTSFVVAVKDA